MVKFNREYFVLTPEDIRAVEAYPMFANSKFMDLARMTSGKPLSNSIYIHEREEVRVLSGMGLDCSSSEQIGAVREYELGCYNEAHTGGIQAEFNFLKQVAGDNGFKIPVPILILLSPVWFFHKTLDDLCAYASLDHNDFLKELINYVKDANLFISDPESNISNSNLAPYYAPPEELVSKKLREKTIEFYEMLLAEEPQWREVYEKI